MLRIHSTSLGLALRSLAFTSLFFLLQIGWQSLEGTTLERVVIHTGTVVPAALLINILTPSIHAQAEEFGLRAIGGGVTVKNGCEGMEAVLLLLSAFAVAPLSWSARGRGLLFGAIMVFVVNQIRIVALFYANRTDHHLFDRLHEIVAPIAVVLVIAGYFYAWLLHATRRPAATA